MSEYRVWECQICGWVYDESKGWPEDGIAPGTRWEDIPEDWSCPECGAAKQDFAMVEVAPPAPAAEPQAVAPVSAPPAANAPSQAQAAHRIWECMVCGWVYDESKGWPEDGIAPGTRWEDIPEDWCCPQCGVGKEDFDMVLVAEAAEAEPAPRPATQTAAGEPVVIVGTGLAGYNLAREFRKLDTSTPLLLISADDGSFYSKPLLSASLAHGKTPQQLASAPAEDMARELNARILVHTRVTAIDPAARSLTLQPEGGSPAQLQGTQVHYSKLVLATGSRVRPLPPIEGSGFERLFRINSLADYRRFRTALVGGKRVLLLGGGLIGCEFANDLAQSGFQVEVVEAAAWPLSGLLPEAAARDLQRGLEAAGVRFHCNSKLVSLARGGAGLSAQLDSGETLHADIALAALGLAPDTGLAESAGLTVKRGIVVDRQLQTSDPHIHALGDCAEVDGHLLFFVAPLVACARALAATLTGTPTQVRYGAIPVAVKTTLRPTVVCPPPASAAGEWHIEATESGVRAEFRHADGRLLGFALTGAAITAREALATECAPLMDL